MAGGNRGHVAGPGAQKTVDSFTKGVGSTVDSAGLLIALGAMIGAQLAESGGADQLVDTVVGSVPPHPGPLVAIASLKADLGLTLLYGIVLAVPTAILAGPVFGNVIARYVHATAPEALLPTRRAAVVGTGGAGVTKAATGEWLIPPPGRP